MKSSEDQEVINQIIAFEAAWSKGDAKAAAALFTEDGTRVEVDGDVTHGRTEIEAGYAKLLHQAKQGAVLKQERGSVRMLSPNLAVWQAGFEIIPAAGGASLHGHIVQVMQKVSGRWLILESHPKLFPPF